MSSNFKIHKSSETLPIYHFNKINKTNDFRYLIHGCFEENIDEFKELKGSEYKDIFEKIEREVILLNIDKKLINNLNDDFNIKYLTYRYETTRSIVDLYLETEEHRVLTLLDDLGWKIDRLKPIGPQIDKLIINLKRLKTKINLSISKFKKRNNIEVDKNGVILEKEQQFVDLDKEALMIEQFLDIKYQLNPREISTKRWFNLRIQYKEKADYVESQTNN